MKNKKRNFWYKNKRRDRDFWYIRHLFHLVDPSPWPILAAVSTFILTSSISMYMHSENFIYAPFGLILGLFLLLSIIVYWFQDIIYEGFIGGAHTFFVQEGLRLGIILFIISEIMLFFSFFWAYFHSSLVPAIDIGSQWPAEFNQLKIFNPFDIPSLNTLILLSSGYTITKSHDFLLSRNYYYCYKNLKYTILFGFLFLNFQLLEYMEATFSIHDGIFGSIFFVSTGFHGFHVLIGTLMLVFSALRFQGRNITQNSHLGYIASIWYWHFVDIVWVVLYIGVYVWPYILILS